MTNVAETAALQRYGTELLERSAGFALIALQPVTRPALALPTPCAGWDLGMLLAHLEDSLAALYEAVDTGVVALDGPPPSGDPVAGCRAALGRLVGAWTAADREGRPVTVAGCPLRAGTIAGAGALELAVHGWDVARALGDDRPVPASLAARLLRIAPMLVPAEVRGELFAPPVRVEEYARPGDRLVALLGRDPDQPLRA